MSKSIVANSLCLFSRDAFVSNSICPDRDREGRQVSDFIECLVSKCIVLSHRECQRLRGELAQARRELEGLSRAAPTASVPSSDVAAIFGRLPRPDDDDSGERRLQLTMKGTQFFALERLAAHFSLSRHAVIEHLIDWADDTLTKSLYDDEAAFNRYIDRDRNKK